MSTEKAPQNSGSGSDTDSQAPDIRANTGENPFLPFNQNRTRPFFEAAKILLEKSAKPEERPVKGPQPSPFKGDLIDHERFLRQLENLFALEHRTFQQGIRKICYVANLLYRNKDDKFGDPASRYESYHLKSHTNVAQRVLGSPQDYLDPKWKEWATFVEALRSSFSNRVSREQAVTDWHLLKHMNSIDDYLDKLIRLMWQTSYKGQTVEDKLKRGLNHKLAEDWASVIKKAEMVEEQIVLHREMGY